MIILILLRLSIDFSSNHQWFVRHETVEVYSSALMSESVKRFEKRVYLRLCLAWARQTHAQLQGTGTPLLMIIWGVNLAMKWMKKEMNQVRNKWRYNHFENALMAVKLSININLHFILVGGYICIGKRIQWAEDHVNQYQIRIFGTAKWFDVGKRKVIGRMGEREGEEPEKGDQWHRSA